LEQLSIGGEYREERWAQRFSEPPGTVVGTGNAGLFGTIVAIDSAGSDGDRDVRSLYSSGEIPARI